MLNYISVTRPFSVTVQRIDFRLLNRTCSISIVSHLSIVSSVAKRPVVQIKNGSTLMVLHIKGIGATGTSVTMD